LVTAMQMKALEQKAIEEYGIDSMLLMENAARSFCDILERETGSVKQRKILVCCGPGNNGGDGFAIGRHLHNRGALVTIGMGCEASQLKGDARKNYDIVTHMGLAVAIPQAIAGQEFDIGIDAIFGTGFHGEPQGVYAELISCLQRQADYIAAVDMPSGTSADSGQVAMCSVEAQLTVTFGLAKVGQFLYPAKEQVGKLYVTDISLPAELINSYPAKFHTMDQELASFLPEREENTHKGSFGKVLILGGSLGMSGACAMAAEAVLRCGAGMVTAAVPSAIQNVMATMLREMMTLPLPMGDEGLSKQATAMVTDKLQKQDVLLAGCGLGREMGTRDVFLSVVEACSKPMVIDADGINYLQGHIHIIQNKAQTPILTPHLMEFSGLSGYSLSEVLANRLSIAVNFATKHQIILVLKSADTIVAHPNGHAYVCSRSNSGMATAGSGDVLSGIIASLLAQGMTPGHAANLGVYIHSQAGWLARENLGAHGMLASDMIAQLSATMMWLTESKGQ